MLPSVTTAFLLLQSPQAKVHKEDVAEALLQQLQGAQQPREVLGGETNLETSRRVGTFEQQPWTNRGKTIKTIGKPWKK